MDRRQFLGATAGLAAAALWPSWLSQAFGEKSDLPNDQALPPGLSGAYQQARVHGKPLLVLVIPQDPANRYQAGQIFGELINHGSPETMATLALCEIVCAKMDDIRLFGSQSFKGEPLMVLFETSGFQPSARMVDAVLPGLPDPYGNQSMDWDSRLKAEDRAVDSRIATVSQLVHRALLEEKVTLKQRAQQATLRLTEAEIQQVRAFGSAETPLPLELADRAAALLMFTARKNGASSQAAVTELLERAAISRLRQLPPVGAQWASSAGCGVHIENSDVQAMVACGMGHVPEKSRRFLYFFSQNEG